MYKIKGIFDINVTLIIYLSPTVVDFHFCLFLLHQKTAHKLIVWLHLVDTFKITLRDDTKIIFLAHVQLRSSMFPKKRCSNKNNGKIQYIQLQTKI